MTIDIEHADILQVQRGIGGELILIEDDVLDVVRRLKEISPSLHVWFNQQKHPKHGDDGYFVVYELCEDGEERLVTTVKELDNRLVAHFERLAHESWDVLAEMDKMDEKAAKAKEAKFAEQVGEIGERLHHALRKDKQVKDHIFVDRDLQNGGEDDQNLR